MKRKRNIIIMLAIIIVLGAVSIMLYSKNEEARNADQSLYMTETKLTDVINLSITYKGETSVYEKTEEGWIYPADTLFPVNNDTIDGIVRKLTTLYANRIVEGNVTPAEFGLDNPICTVSATDKDGQNITYYVGDFNGSLNRYYFMTEGSDTIYLVGQSQTETFFKTRTDTVGEYDLSQVNSNNATKITVDSPDAHVVVKRIAPEDNINLYSSEFKWAITEPYSTPLPADSNKILSIASKMGKLNLSLVTYTPNQEDLAEYGLNTPTAKISIDYSYSKSLKDYNENATLLFGKTTENGDTYVKFEEFPLVYTIPKDDYDLMGTFFASESFMPNKICEIDLKTIDSMVITTQNTTYNVEVANTNGSATYLVNGTTVDSADFEAFYKKLTSITREKTSDETFENYNKLSVTFNRNTDTFSQMELSYFEYDNTFSRAEFNGINNLLVNRKSVDSAISALEKLVQ